MGKLLDSFSNISGISQAPQQQRGGSLFSFVSQNIATPQTPQQLQEEERGGFIPFLSRITGIGRKPGEGGILSEEAIQRVQQPETPAVQRIRARGEEPIPERPTTTAKEFFRPSVIAKTTTDLAKDIARDIPRAVLTAALSTVGKVILPETERIVRPREDFGRIGEILLGKAPIKPISQTGTDFLKGLGVSGDQSRKFGIPIGMALVAVDLFPGLKTGKVAVNLAKLSDFGKLMKLLKKETKLTDEVLTPLARELVNIADPKEVDKRLLAFAVDPANYKPISGLDITIPVPTKGATGLEPLAVEARKFKSAEEFVEAQPKLFHGTTKKSALAIEKGGFEIGGKTNINKDFIGIDKELLGDVVWLTDTPQRAKVFAGQSGRLKFGEDAGIIQIAESNLKLAKPSDAIGGTLQADNAKLFRAKIEDLKSKGFDGLQRTRAETIVWNVDKIKTKSQLTDIYNQAKRTGRVAEEVAPAVARGAKEVVEGVVPKVAREAGEQAPESVAKGIPTEGVQPPVNTTPSFPDNTALKESLSSKITEGLQKAEPVRVEISEAQTAERASRFAKFDAMIARDSSEKGWERALGSLKGELLKEAPKIEGLRKFLTQQDVDDSFRIIKEHSFLNTTDRIHTMNGFARLLEGAIPQPSQLVLMEDVFGKEMILELLKKRASGIFLKDAALDVINIPRTLMTTLDLSSPLRQGLFLSLRHPIKATGALSDAFKNMFSKEAYLDWFKKFKETPLARVAKESGLYVAESHKVSSGVLAKEEAYASTLGENIPGLKQLFSPIRPIVKASERGYTSFLNSLRVSVFDDMTKAALESGSTPRSNPTLYKAIADFINVTTGRGKLGALEKINPILNASFFSPRLIASRLTMLNPAWYLKMPPQVRKEALKSWLTLIGTGMTVLYMAKAAGADVEVDPRSSDFGKIRVGDSRWDIWGGLQQYVTFTARILTGEVKTGAGDIRKLEQEIFPHTTRLDVMQNFIRGKLAPVAAFGADVLAGGNIVGEDLDLGTEAIENFVPMYIQDVKEAWDDLGPSAALTVGVPTFFGVGFASYEAGISERAVKELQTLGTLPPEQATERLKQIQTDEPNLAEAITRRYRDIARGITDDDRFLRGLPVKDRAEEIVDNLRSFDTPEEQTEYLTNLVEKGILTVNTLKEIQRQLSEK